MIFIISLLFLSPLLFQSITYHNDLVLNINCEYYRRKQIPLQKINIMLYATLFTYSLLLALIATAVLRCWQQFFTTVSTKTEIRSSSRPFTEEKEIN